MTTANRSETFIECPHCEGRAHRTVSAGSYYDRPDIEGCPMCQGEGVVLNGFAEYYAESKATEGDCDICGHEAFLVKGICAKCYAQMRSNKQRAPKWSKPQGNFGMPRSADAFLPAGIYCDPGDRDEDEEAFALDYKLSHMTNEERAAAADARIKIEALVATWAGQEDGRIPF